MKKLGIIGAMEIEIETLKAQMEDLTVTQKAGSEFYEGTLGGLPVVLVQCGIGKVNATIGTQILCDLYAVTHIVNTGIAGSLAPEQDIGDMVVSRDVMHHDFNCVAFGYEHCRIPGMPLRFAADETMVSCAVAAAEKTGATVRVGGVASGDQFVSEESVKDRIVEKTGALCTEMEGAAIAQTAYRNGVPFVILRCISDKADSMADFDYPVFEKMAAQRCAQVTMALAQALC